MKNGKTVLVSLIFLYISHEKLDQPWEPYDMRLHTQRIPIDNLWMTKHENVSIKSQNTAISLRTIKFIVFIKEVWEGI